MAGDQDDEEAAAMTVPDAVVSATSVPAAERDSPGPDARTPGVVGRRSRPRRPNDLIRRARLSLASPSDAGGPMSRAELAQAVTVYLHLEHGVEEKLNQDDIGRLERGRTRWPGKWRRVGLRAVLGAASDAELGLFKTHPHPSNEEPLPADDPGGGLVEAGADWWVAGAVAPPVYELPGPSPRVVLHWTGRKACALRVAMRMSVRDFAAKLGINDGVVGQCRHGGRLRYETHRILDTMLSLATDDDLLRFDLALQEIGECR